MHSACPDGGNTISDNAQFDGVAVRRNSQHIASADAEEFTLDTNFDDFEEEAKAEEKPKAAAPSVAVDARVAVKLWPARGAATDATTASTKVVETTTGKADFTDCRSIVLAHVPGKLKDVEYAPVLSFRVLHQHLARYASPRDAASPHQWVCASYFCTHC